MAQKQKINTGLKVVIGIIVVLGLLAWCIHEIRLGGQRGRVVVPFELTGDGFIEVAAGINGKDARFVVDTAAKVSIIHTRHAEALGLVTRETENTARGLGTPSHPMWDVDPFVLVIGTLHHRCTDFVALDLAHIDAAAGERPLHGLLGSPFLSQYKASIDYSTRRMTLQVP